MFTKKLIWVLVFGFMNLISVDAKERSFIYKRCSLTELKVIETVVSMKWSSINQILILLFVCAA